MPHRLQGNEFRAVKVTFILNLRWITHIEVVLNPLCPHKYLVLEKAWKTLRFNYIHKQIEPLLRDSL